MSSTIKFAWRGVALAVQPRIRLLRSFDERSHSDLGYVIFLDGELNGEHRPFSVGLGKAAYLKHAVRRGDEVSGQAAPVPDPSLEIADLYKASKLKVHEQGPDDSTPPPWHMVAPELAAYRSRGHRRLDPRTYRSKCESCNWGCRMPVEIITDKWNPARTQHRFETFCYGPLSCALYRAGPNRTVTGRKGMTFVEEDWVDQDSTIHRSPDE